MATGIPTLAAVHNPSGTIWGLMPWDDRDLFDSGHVQFSSSDQTTLVSNSQDGGLVIDAGSSVALQTTNYKGVLRMTTQAADGDQVAWTTGDNTAGSLVFTAGKRMGFEVCISPVQIAAHDLAIGLCSETLAAASAIIGASDTQADVDFVGFVSLQATPTILNCVYNTSGAGGITTVKTTGITMVAATYYRVGLYCDGTRATWFVNGSPIESCAVAHPVRIDTSGFPDDEEMQAIVQIQSTTTTAVSLDIDWARWAMER